MICPKLSTGEPLVLLPTSKTKVSVVLAGLSLQLVLLKVPMPLLLENFFPLQSNNSSTVQELNGVTWAAMVVDKAMLSDTPRQMH